MILTEQEQEEIWELLCGYRAALDNVLYKNRTKEDFDQTMNRLDRLIDKLQ